MGPLIEVMKNDQKRDVRSVATIPVARIGGARGVEPLIGTLRKEVDPIVVWGAELALGEIRDVNAVEALIVALKDEEWIIRQGAAEALGKIQDVRAVEPLIKALDDENQRVREAANKALEKLNVKKKKRFTSRKQLVEMGVVIGRAQPFLKINGSHFLATKVTPSELSFIHHIFLCSQED